MPHTASFHSALKGAAERALDEVTAATKNIFQPDDPISILTLRTLALLALRESDAVPLADVLLDYANEQLRSAAYNAVLVEHRTAFVRASVLKALALIVPCVAKSDEVSQEALCEALKTLDTGLLMAGRPAHERTVMELVTCISRLLEPHAVGSSPPPEPPRYSDPRPIIAFPPPTASMPPSIYAFTTRIAAFGTRPLPLHMKGAVADWPACSTRPWADLTYLRAAIGAHRTVPIEIGAKYTDAQWTQKLVTVAEFIDGYITASEGRGVTTNDNRSVAYLAQHDLFSQIPRLREDICIPDYCFVHLPSNSADADDDNTSDKEVAVNAWFGPRGTISPLHHDPHNNMFAQVVGSKYIRLYAPEQSAAVYPNEEESMMSNTSRVDVESADLISFPDFASAPYFECIVEPGDLLFIPVGGITYGLWS
ncbi:Lysine-specific demethylase 8 [Geranomyces michiganensis]|nr:Lysine-specific demethylase 8 [Geranomyces michiganensis]